MTKGNNNGQSSASNEHKGGAGMPGPGDKAGNNQQQRKAGKKEEDEEVESSHNSSNPSDPNDPGSPEKRIQIDDNPDETQKKIPHI